MEVMEVMEAMEETSTRYRSSIAQSLLSPSLKCRWAEGEMEVVEETAT